MRHLLLFLAVLGVFAGTRHPRAQSAQVTTVDTVHTMEGGEPFPKP
jgi:hypothetical protein